MKTVYINAIVKMIEYGFTFHEFENLESEEIVEELDHMYSSLTLKQLFKEHFTN